MSKKTRKKPSLERSPAKEPDRSPKTLNGHFLYNPIVHISLIVLFGLLAYSNTFNVPFHFDDYGNIVGNNRITDISNLPAFFTHIKGPSISARPLTAATFAINYYLDGLNTIGYHIVNLLLHIANGILLYFLIILTAGRLDFHDDKKTILIALFSSLIFIVHPIQTESATYIVSRSVLLSTFFFFLGIIFFTKAVGSTGRKKAAWIAALFIISLLGMASREEFFLFPVMLILYDLYFISKQDIKGVLKNYDIHLPVILTLGYVLYIVLSYDYGEHAGYGVKEFTPLEYLMTQFNVHWTYIRLLFLPINQNLDYDYPIAKTVFELPTILSFFGYIGLWGAGIYLYRKKPIVSFCILWFMITLAPSSSIMPILDVIFERRLYMPGTGIIIAFASSFFYVLQFAILRSRFTAYASRIPLSIAYFLLSTAVVVLSIATYQRNTVWKDEIALWEDVVKKSSDKARGHNNLGDVYFNMGWNDKAIEHFQAAIRLKPDNSMGYNNLGVAYFNMGWNDKAIEQYQIAIRLKPDDVEAHNNLGNAYSNKGLLDKAIEQYQIAIKLKPDFVEIYYNFGLVYEKKGLLTEAINQYQTALRFNPDFRPAKDSLSRIFRIESKQGDNR